MLCAVRNCTKKCVLPVPYVTGFSRCVSFSAYPAFIFRICCFPVFILFAACNPTKYIPQGEYLLESVDVAVDNKSIPKEDLSPRIQQKSNKKIIGTRFHLWLYNSSKLGKDNRWNNWLRKNGEEPVIWQQSLNDRSEDQLKLFLENKGYYYAEITDTVIFKKKKAAVIYNIKTGWPYTVSAISYAIPDTAIARLVLADTVNSLLKPGILLDVDILAKERKRIETNLKDRGYYSFAEDYIEYEPDSAFQNRTARLNVVIRPNTMRTEDNQVIEAPYPLYTIRSLTVNASLSMQNLLDMTSAQKTASDTLTQGDVRFIIPPRFPVKASTIRNSIYIFPDSLYRISKVNQTYQHLHGLRNFKQVGIELPEPKGQTDPLMRELDCQINLLPLTRQSLMPEVELTNSEGNMGGGVKFQYQNKSLFGHAEIFDLKLHGMAEAVTTKNFGIKTKMEYEAEATLNVPKFLLPFRSSRFIQMYNPKTFFSVLYNYQQRPDYYERTVFSTSFGYNWRGSEVISHTVKPLDVNFVQLPFISPDFDTYLNSNPYLKNSYQSHMVVSSSYTFVRDMRPVNADNSFFVRTNFETAGLLLDAAYRLSGKSRQSGQPHKMLGNAFSQFVKGDIDLRYYFTINGNNNMVSRIFAGVGFPYGNSEITVESDGITQSVAAMPFEKKYYVGGANSIRGWRLRSLGPGSYVDSTAFTNYPNNTGDIKLEANLEYRYKLVWLMEGALFVDAGNVWDVNKDKNRPGADFSFDRFYREIALSGGVGLRVNFNYFVFRIDAGMKIRDPSGNGRWVFEPKPNEGRRLDWDDFNLSFAIGYPFF